MSFQSKLVAVGSLERDADSCCVVDTYLQVLYCNPAWDAFARANGGSDAALGKSLINRNLLTFIPEVLKPFFSTGLRSAFSGVGTWKHDYECSSPAEFRIFRLQALPLRDANELLLCHTRMVAGPHYRAPKQAQDRQGPVRMCALCRCTSQMNGSTWDWIPEYLARPPEPRVDDLCDSCSAYYRLGKRPWPEGIIKTVSGGTKKSTRPILRD